MQKRDLKFTLSAVDKTKRVFSKVTKGLKSITKAVFSMKSAFVLAAGVTGLGLLVKSSLDAIDNLGKLSRVLGLTTRELAAFELAAEIGGMNLEQFAKASRQVSKNVFDFLVRGSGEAVDAFKQLGITQRDLLPIQNDQVAILALIGDRFAQMENGAVKTAVAVKLFGSRAAAMLNVFEAGGGSTIRQAAKDVELFGNALDSKTVRGVEEANDAMTRLKFLFRGVRDQIVAALAPALAWLADFVRNKLLDAFNKNGLGVKGWAKATALAIIDFTIKSLKAFQGFIDSAIIAWNRAKLLFAGGLLSSQDRQAELTIDVSKGKAELDKLKAKIDKTLEAMADTEYGTTKYNNFVSDLKMFQRDHKEVTDQLKADQEELATLDAKLKKSISKGTGFLNPMLGFLGKFRNELASTKEDAGGVGDALKSIIPEEVAADLVNFTKAFKNGLDSVMDKMTVTTETIAQSWDKTFTSLRDDLARFFETGKLSFKGFIGTIRAELAKLAANKLLSMLFSKFAGGGSALSTLTGASAAIGGAGGAIPKRAFGGPVTAGGPVIVGERGPELLIPRNNGRVVPNNQLGGGGENTTIVQNISMNTDVKNTVRAEIINAAPAIAQMAVAAVEKKQAGLR